YQMEERARGLIKALTKTKAPNDPAALQGAITAIAQAARQALFAPPIARVRSMDNFQLSPHSHGFDFGPPDSAAMPRFQHITAKDERLAGANRRALRRPSSDELFSDGVVNVEKFTADIPNGKWRVVLLTDDLGIGKSLTNPLGQNIRINGNSVRIAQTDPASWLTTGILSGTGGQTTTGGQGGQTVGQKKNGDNGGAGGMVIIETEVVNGKLVIDLEKLQGLSTYLTAIIVEPADEKSNFDLREEARDHYRYDSERLAATNARIDEQIGAVLSEIATAAGPQQIAAALGIEQPAVEPNTQASPN
nr:hypothetical protein [Alphaproteobacteria bacterium]